MGESHRSGAGRGSPPKYLDDREEVRAIDGDVRRGPDRRDLGPKRDAETSSGKYRGVGHPIPNVGDLERSDSEPFAQPPKAPELVGGRTDRASDPAVDDRRGSGETVRPVEPERPRVPIRHVSGIVGQEGNASPEGMEPFDAGTDPRHLRSPGQDRHELGLGRSFGNREEVADVLVLPDLPAAELRLSSLELVRTAQGIRDGRPAVVEGESPVEVERDEPVGEGGHGLGAAPSLSEPDPEEDSPRVQGDEPDREER
jgi:hypothetical protein